MSDLIDGYSKSGLVSNKEWYENFVCGDCYYFTGEECDGFSNEGCERYSNDTACEEFKDNDEGNE